LLHMAFYFSWHNPPRWSLVFSPFSFPCSRLYHI
jgi:hypothetical protein